MTLIRPSLDLSRVTAWGGANQGVIVLFLQIGGQDLQTPTIKYVEVGSVEAGKRSIQCNASIWHVYLNFRTLPFY